MLSWRSNRLLRRSCSVRFTHSGKYAGMDGESFSLLATHYTPFMREIFRPQVHSLDIGKLTVALPFRAELVGKSTEPACLHGGAVAAMFDHVAGFCAWSALDASRKTVSTVDLRIDYLLPAPCEELYFDAVVVSKTKKLVRVDAECWDSRREHKIAIARGLFNIYDSKIDFNALVDEFRK